MHINEKGKNQDKYSDEKLWYLIACAYGGVLRRGKLSSLIEFTIAS